MAKGEIGSKVKELRLSKTTLRPADVARSLGVSPQRYSNWESGRSDPPHEHWGTLKELFGLRSNEELLEGTARGKSLSSLRISMAEHAKRHQEIRSLFRIEKFPIPLWSSIEVDEATDCVFFPADPYEDAQVPHFMVGDGDEGEHIVCIPSGISLGPRMIQGDRVIVRIDPNPPVNSIVLVQLNDVYKLRILNYYPERMVWGYRHPGENTERPTLPLVQPVAHYGVVIGIWKPYITRGPNMEWNFGHPLVGKG